MIIKEIILYQLFNGEKNELGRMPLNRKNLRENKKFVKMKNRDLFLENKSNDERFFFRIKAKEIN